MKEFNPYLTNFATVDDIIREYEGTSREDLEGATILLAWYGYGSYCGSSLVLYKKNDKLYEVNGSHCSCYGLEDQWRPEETSWAALAMRNLSSDDEGAGEAQELLTKLVEEHK